MTGSNAGPATDGHVIVVDLGYGDAGKGTVVDWLCASRPVHTVVRFNGGAQAGHNVVTPDGRHHTFAQFGSGTFRGGRTHLARFCVVDPLALAAEADHLAELGVADPLDLVTVDAAALLATPYHRAANRAREAARGADRHGSCGMGIGEVMAYALAHPDEAPRVGDCATPGVLADKLEALRSRLATGLGRFAAEVPPVADCVTAFRAFVQRVSIVDGEYLRRLLRRERVVFEGAQGVLLDEWHGFHPYTTWSTTTFDNAERLLAEAGGGTPLVATRLGVLRVVTTRHGPGPLVTEDPTLTADLPDPHNPANRWQGGFRVGHFDVLAHRYAIEAAGGVDVLALTHLDVAERHPGLRWCREYREMSHIPVERGVPSDPSGAPDPTGPAAHARLARAERLTRRLLRARPVLDAAPTARCDGSSGAAGRSGAAGWIDAVGEALGAPVVVTSTGPTSADKRSLWSAAAGRCPALPAAVDNRPSWSAAAGRCPALPAAAAVVVDDERLSWSAAADERSASSNGAD